MLITLENRQIRAVVSSFAGAIESIYNKKTEQEHFWQYNKAVWPRRTPICFPVCGAMTDNEYTYKGKTYPMPMHGILRENDLTVVEQSDSKVIFEFHSNEKTKRYYPFAFRFLLTEELRENSLIVSYTVENTGDKELYYSTGAHYTYQVPIVAGECQADYEYVLKSEMTTGQVLVEDNHVCGKLENKFHGGDCIDLAGFFENGATILSFPNDGQYSISIRSKKTGTETEVSFEGFLYCVLWALKGDSPFACIEPWDGLADQIDHDKDITKKLGVNCLARGKSRTYVQKITVI